MWDSGWDKIFASNDWGQYPPEELIRFVSRAYRDESSRKNIKVLEIGCGTGANIWFLAREGFQVTGIDGSQNAIAKCQKRLVRESLEAELQVGDVLQLPFENESFDCVIDNECIYANSYKDSEKIVQEVKRVLKPGGLFYSRTFATGTYGDGNGVKLEGEKNTYLSINEGALRSDYGLIRFTDEEEIQNLYGTMHIDSIDYLIRSVSAGAHEIKEWIIACSKA